MRRLLLVAGLLVSSLALSKDRSPPQSPPAAESAYMQIEGGGFMMNFGSEIVGASYGVKVSLRKDLPPGSVAVATFDNPENASAPFEVSVEISPGSNSFLLKSPKFTSATNSKIYNVRIRLFSDTERKNELDSINQGILLYVPKELMPRAGITFKDG